MSQRHANSALAGSIAAALRLSSRTQPALNYAFGPPEIAASSKAWPFEEARKVLKRLEKAGPARAVVFETGYGPSGLPHIGTFGEVARTSMVRQALTALKPGVKTRLVCFSDDMDGLRKKGCERLYRGNA